MGEEVSVNCQIGAEVKTEQMRLGCTYVCSENSSTDVLAGFEDHKIGFRVFDQVIGGGQASHPGPDNQDFARIPVIHRLARGCRHIPTTLCFLADDIAPIPSSKNLFHQRKQTTFLHFIVCLLF